MERDFFARDPWNQLANSGRTGIESLRNIIRELLMDITKKELPSVKDEIRKRLSENTDKLEKMGPSRSNGQAQRIFLGKISDSFQKICGNALDAHYTRDSIFKETSCMRLITRIMELNQRFSEVFLTKGHTRHFADKNRKERKEVTPVEVSLKLRRRPHVDPSYGKSEESPHRPRELLCPINMEQCQEIRDLIGDSFDCPSPENGSIMDHIEDQLRYGRGRELATVPETLLATTFMEQTKKWEPLVISHVSNAICIVHEFIKKLLEVVCPETAVRDELWELLLDELRGSYKKAMDQARFLLEVERNDWPMTLNHCFSNNLAKNRVDRMVDLSNLSEYNTDEANDMIQVNRNVLKGVQTEKSLTEHARDEVHDALQSYYNVSCKRFVDVVCQQAVNHFLLIRKSSPLHIFSNEWVNRMTTDQLDAIAGEDSANRQQRKQLMRDIDRLDAAMKVLRG